MVPMGLQLLVNITRDQFNLQKMKMKRTTINITKTDCKKIHSNLVSNEYLQINTVRTMDTTYLHIGMILSTLGLSPHGFALGLYPKGLIPMEIFVHPYIPMILPISNQCGTLVVYPTGHTSRRDCGLKSHT